MKKFVFTKTFDNENELNTFVNNYVGDKNGLGQVSPKFVTIDGLTMIIVIRYSNIFWKRKQIYDKYGFVMERKE
jgi:hypothetical protein